MYLFFWHTEPLLDEAMDVPGPFRPVEGGGYTLEGRFNTGMAAIRGSLKLRHDALVKFL